MTAFACDLSFGAAPIDKHRTRFRLWAPSADAAAVQVEGAAAVPLKPAEEGWFEGEADCGPGAQYRYQVGGQLVPDPASRGQAADVNGPSLVIDPRAYAWRNPDWAGRPWEETVIYELHAGLMGGFSGVAARLPELKALGITAVELMPIADFSGKRNWGYDGVLPYAPDRAYGSPDDLKALVDCAHDLGLMIFLDVVYNHFGPDGNYLKSYAAPFFRHDLHTPWGEAIDFRLRQVRDFFTENAVYWIQEYRFDGLRFDAVHAISEQDWLVEMATALRAAAGPDRHVHLIVENERNGADLITNAFDAQWNDDFHNVMHVLLTGETGAYYEDFADQPAERLARCLAEGFIYQGEPSPHHNGAPRGAPSSALPPLAFVSFLQNHDQVGNRALGERLPLLADPDALKAATALLLLAPQIPLLFMGEEDGSETPFLFFTDFHDELANAVREGRRKEFSKFPAFSDPERRKRIPDPNALQTYEASRPAPGTGAQTWRALYTELLRLRRSQITPRLKGARALHARAIGPKAVLARWRLGDGAVMTIALNLDAQAVAIEKPVAAPLYGVGFLGKDPGQLAPRCLQVWMQSA